MSPDPRELAHARALEHKRQSADRMNRTIRTARVTTVVLGVLFIALGAGFTAMLVPGVRTAVLGPSGPPVVFAILGPSFALVGILSLALSSVYAPPSARLLTEGQPGRATIRDVQGGRFSIQTQSGTVTRNMLILDVEVAGAPAYEVRYSTFIPYDSYALLRPGSTLAVRVNRNNPKALVVDWEASRSQTARG